MTVRTLLTAAQNYYVRTDGNDANDGSANDAAHAWATIQHALDWIKQNIDLGNYRAYVNLGNAGNYAGFLVFNHFVGGSNCNFTELYLQAPVIIRGPAGTLDRVIVGGNDVANSVIGIEWVKFQDPGNNTPALKASMGGHIFRGFVEFGTRGTGPGGIHEYVCHGGRISTYGGCNISGGGWARSFAERQANIEDYGIPAWVEAITTLVGFTAGYYVSGDQGFILVNGKTYAGAGNVTPVTPQCSVYNGGGIQTWGGLAAIPGSGFIGVGSNGAWVN